MAKLTAVRSLALAAVVCACALPATGWAQAQPPIKRNFLCVIELPPDFSITVNTNDTAKVCAASYISIACRAPLSADQNPGVTNLAGVACEIDGVQCGVDSEEPLPATQSTLKIGTDGIARLNCLHRF